MPNYTVKQENNSATGGFFCHACLVDKLLSEQSADPRYCWECCDFLLKEAEVLLERGLTRRPDWIPQPQIKEVEREKGKQVVGDMPRIMSTLASQKSEVDIIHPSPVSRASSKRGPKHKALPQELIKQWAGKGMGSKAIASKLKNEPGIKVSYKTIQRLLSGEREFGKHEKITDKQ